MITFIIGLVILFVGAALYGKFCEHVFGPDDRKTPAYTKQDGVDYVPMRGWKNSLINLHRKRQDRIQCSVDGPITKEPKKAGNYQTLSPGSYPLYRFHFLINM